MGVSTHIQNQMMMSGRLLLITVSCFAALAKAGNIAEELTAAGATTLVDFVVKAVLAETLSGPGPFTVFAPDNAAFAKLPADLVATLSGDTELLKKVLLFHVLSGNVMSKDVTNDLSVASVEGTELRANVYLKSKYYDGFVTINGKRVYKTDILADKDALTKVLLRHVVPGTMFSKGITWTTHNTAGGAEEDMVATQVFKAGVIKVVSSVDGKRSGARVVDADIIATNGVIHAIDTVI